MNTAQQDALTLRRIIVWQELFNVRSTKERCELTKSEKELYDMLTQALLEDLAPVRTVVEPPMPPLQAIANGL